mgnify:CR=1 FL=1
MLQYPLSLLLFLEWEVHSSFWESSSLLCSQITPIISMSFHSSISLILWKEALSLVLSLP